MSAVWRVSLMLILNRLLLNGEYVVINALKTSVSIISVWSPCKFLMEYYSKIFYIIYKWDIPQMLHGLQR
jgi:hypothetical protein